NCPSQLDIAEIGGTALQATRLNVRRRASDDTHLDIIVAVNLGNPSEMSELRNYFFRQSSGSSGNMSNT
ncbi:MAG: hypothetical protein ACKPKO_37275, partial [Candidatus Fonsibacter sp.]